MKVNLYTDGGVRTGGVNGPTKGSSGPGAAGFVIYDMEGTLLKEGALFLDETTVNVAEYSAVIVGLYNAQLLGATHVSLYSDSQLIVNQINSKWQCKSARLGDYLAEVRHEIKEFEEVIVSWIPRAENTHADEMTRRVLG